jgi:hypothetical protein
MAAIFQYGGHAQIFNFLKPPLYDMAARVLFLNII